MKSKVSIIVPVYNTEKYIKACLDSLLDQSLKEIEIICVDDGSTDSSLEVLKRYEKKDSRIKVFSRENGGRSAARNTGLKAVSSPYVMFCDSDDSFDKNMCKKMVDGLEHHSVDLAICGIGIKYEAHDDLKDSDDSYYRLKFYGKNYIDDSLILKTDASVCNKIFRFEVLKKYGINFPEELNNEDYYFYNAYMSVSRTCYYINQRLYNYIRHKGSIMSDNFERNICSSDHLLVAEKLFLFYKRTGFIKKHTDLFWTQFSESFWFSYNHSAKKYRVKINKIAKDFISKNYEKYPPINKKVKNKVSIILNNNIFYRSFRNIHYFFRRMYLKVNIAYRQQNYINALIAEFDERAEDLSDRLDNIMKEGK